MGDTHRQANLTVSSPDLLLSVRRLAFLQHLTEVSIGLVVAGSLAAGVLVRTPGHSGLVGGGLLTAGLAVVRSLVLAGIRQRTGPHRVALHASGGWLVVRPAATDPALGLSFDLRGRALPAGPLLRPGVALVAALLVAQIAGHGLSSSAASWIGAPATLAAAALLLHQAAAAVLAHEPARRRFRRVLPWLLLLLAAVAVLRLARAGSPVTGWLVQRWSWAWLDLLPAACGLWLAWAALAAVHHDRPLLASLAAMLALALAGGPSPHVWAAFAVGAALGSELTPAAAGDAGPAPRP